MLWQQLQKKSIPVFNSNSRVFNSNSIFNSNNFNSNPNSGIGMELQFQFRNWIDPNPATCPHNTPHISSCYNNEQTTKQTKAIKKLIQTHISCKCDTNRAGHFTLDGHASRPVACSLIHSLPLAHMANSGNTEQCSMTTGRVPPKIRGLAHPSGNTKQYYPGKSVRTNLYRCFVMHYFAPAILGDSHYALYAGLHSHVISHDVFIRWQ